MAAALVPTRRRRCRARLCACRLVWCTRGAVVSGTVTLRLSSRHEARTGLSVECVQVAVEWWLIRRGHAPREAAAASSSFLKGGLSVWTMTRLQPAVTDELLSGWSCRPCARRALPASLLLAQCRSGGSRERRHSTAWCTVNTASSAALNLVNVCVVRAITPQPALQQLQRLNFLPCFQSEGGCSCSQHTSIGSTTSGPRETPAMAAAGEPKPVTLDDAAKQKILKQVRTTTFGFFGSSLYLLRLQANRALEDVRTATTTSICRDAAGQARTRWRRRLPTPVTVTVAVRLECQCTLPGVLF